jgi:hypothetical protein
VDHGTSDVRPRAEPVNDYRELYTQVCESYRAIDDFRMKLLALLPVATGAGVLVLLNSGKVDLNATGSDLDRMQLVLAGIAIFGVAITLGLFAYELHGIKKCGRLIKIGARLERAMGSSGPVLGQFATRPHRVARHIDVPFASSVVYPASVAAWVFVGLVSLSATAAVAVSGGVLLFLFALSVWGCRRLDKKLEAWDRAQELLHHLADEHVEGHRASASHLAEGGSRTETHERRCLPTRVVLAAMQTAENPGMVRFGPRSGRHRGWVIDPRSANAEPSPSVRPRRPVLYLCTDGRWWSRKEGRLLRLDDAPAEFAAGQVDSMLRQLLSNQQLRWPE